MNYFEAVQEGRIRVQEAVNALQTVVGQCHPMLFLKVGGPPWLPVGSEMLYSVILGAQGTAAVIICDADGNAKVMSAWTSREKAEEYARVLASQGKEKFGGEVNLPV